MIRLQRSRDFGALHKLDVLCFPADDPYPKDRAGAVWWLAVDDIVGPVGFCGVVPWEPDNAVFLCRAGVLPVARGRGLQRRMIRIREAWARAARWRWAYTYTSVDNLTSANNLIRCKYRLWEPAIPWGGAHGSEALYWYRDLAPAD